MRRAVTKPRLVTREIAERDLEMLQFHAAVQKPQRMMEGAAAAVVFLAVIAVVMACGAIFGLRLMGWV